MIIYMVTSVIDVCFSFLLVSRKENNLCRIFRSLFILRLCKSMRRLIRKGSPCNFQAGCSTHQWISRNYRMFVFVMSCCFHVCFVTVLIPLVTGTTRDRLSQIEVFRNTLMSMHLSLKKNQVFYGVEWEIEANDGSSGGLSV